MNSIDDATLREVLGVGRDAGEEVILQHALDTLFDLFHSSQLSIGYDVAMSDFVVEHFRDFNVCMKIIYDAALKGATA